MRLRLHSPSFDLHGKRQWFHWELSRCQEKGHLHSPHIKTPVRQHFTLTGMESWKQIMVCIHEEVDKMKLFYSSGGDIKWYSHVRKQIERVEHSYQDMEQFQR